MKKNSVYLCFFMVICCAFKVDGQNSIARKWNEQVLEAIRNDFARPTVHARNLHHTSIAMYDIWAAYTQRGDTYLLGKTVNDFACSLDTIPAIQESLAMDMEKAISYAVYRLIRHRFKNAPRYNSIERDINNFFIYELGYDTAIVSKTYVLGAAEFGNYVADRIIAYGLADNSNEVNAYKNSLYEPVNQPMYVEGYSTQMDDPNRWQPLGFESFIDQSGTATGDNVPSFIGAEWGNVYPFALSEDDRSVKERDGQSFTVYHDPGPPPYLTQASGNGLEDNYRWGHTMVAIWSGHLNPDDGVYWDISPASIGNILSYPDNFDDMRSFYNYFEGGDYGTGHSLNPKTGQAYTPQIVPRGDYARVLAEFWADGPDSETPPGHWFTILNYVQDQPEFVRKMEGVGVELSPLEWDVKAYFTLGGAVHDAAISAWGIKGYYDYVRPVSAIRYMGSQGQCNDPSKSTYSPMGIFHIPDYLEPVDDSYTENYVYFEENSTKGLVWLNEYISPDDPVNVGWFPLELWLPYQRATFVTPPFAGYVSGHSTYSRAAAEVLTALTGDAFFPGGMGEFVCEKDNFLVFETGPSETLTLQWATYRDAADQCSLSRIWGGIHPPADDIPGRLIGEKVGKAAFAKAKTFFDSALTYTSFTKTGIYPNPTLDLVTVSHEYEGIITMSLYSVDGRLRQEVKKDFSNGTKHYLDLRGLNTGTYILVGIDEKGKIAFSEKINYQQ